MALLVDEFVFYNIIFMPSLKEKNTGCENKIAEVAEFCAR